MGIFALNKQQKLQVAARMAAIEPFHVMDLLAKARQMESQGRSIVHMEIGEPDFVTPQPVVEAGIKALREGYTHYTPAVGLPALRQAIAQRYADAYHVSVEPDHIVLTPGASGALLLILGVLINPGDQVLMTDPGYPCNRHFVRLLEGEAVGIPVDASTHYQLTPELLQRHWTPKARAVMLASPANPTGAVISATQLQQLIEFVEQQNAYLIMDEIYHGLVYGASAPTAAGCSENVLVINSFSKYYTMTGWRLGWLVAPQSIIRDIDKLAQNIFLAPATVSQYAALAAFNADTVQILEQRRAEFQHRRDYLLPQLRQLGFDIPIEPEGAFYLYADCSRFTNDSYGFCETLLQQAGVAVTPGIDFGHHAPQNHVRFAYTTSMENLQEGINRIEAFLQQNNST
jgi:aspartate/methionine/tyrosine aminotransferase